MRSVKVNVVWENEKMSCLPISTCYSTVAKFLEDADEWPKEGWSIVLEFLPGHSINEATARFLMPNAPWGRLKTGCVFELYEGSRKTATVTVL